ncbi:MAG: hypothetical protein WC595_00420 [Candidatus Nanoarchaeia archaeon]
MITYHDQIELFTLMSKQLKRDVVCYAFGGNAMMFYGYKDETKDVDLLFEDEKGRQDFIEALKEAGYKETSLFKIYTEDKVKEKNAPLMFKRGEGRFDLFVKKIFRTVLSPKMKEDLEAVHDFKDKFNLKVNVLKKEHLVFLKAVTSRQNDFDDIKTIVKKEKHFDWQYFVDEVVWQYQNGNDWAVLDAEKMMKELKEYVFIEEKYSKQLYAALK